MEKMINASRSQEHGDFRRELQALYDRHTQRGLDPKTAAAAMIDVGCGALISAHDDLSIVDEMLQPLLQAHRSATAARPELADA